MSDETQPQYFSFGEGEHAWAAPNPLASGGLQSQAAAYDYLVRICPDTKTAVAKLRAIRAKLRATPVERTR